MNHDYGYQKGNIHLYLISGSLILGCVQNLVKDRLYCSLLYNKYVFGRLKNNEGFCSPFTTFFFICLIFCACNLSPLPVSKNSMNVNNDLLFFSSEGTPLQIWPQIINPSQPATLPTSLQACTLKNHIIFYLFYHTRNY